MLITITSAEEAELVLKNIAGRRARGMLIFDLDASIEDWRSIPFVWRTCQNKCEDGEYLGWNIWGEGLHKSSIYCQKCGYLMDTRAMASLVLQGSRVLVSDNRTTGRRDVVSFVELEKVVVDVLDRFDDGDDPKDLIYLLQKFRLPNDVLVAYRTVIAKENR